MQPFKAGPFTTAASCYREYVCSCKSGAKPLLTVTREIIRVGSGQTLNTFEK